MYATFGPFVFDRQAHRLEREGRRLAVQPKVLEALASMLRRPGEVVTRAQLKDALWPDVRVTDQSLRQVVRKLREALGDDERQPRYVATLHGIGYRFLAEVRRCRPLPAERDPFVGRAAELTSLGAAVASARLVTVLGIGGVGKTRLVLRFVRTSGARFGERWLCELAEARTLHGIVGAVSSTFDVPLSAGDPVEQLGRAIGARGPCLVVLDNFEQVARYAPATLGRWLDLAPAARFVCTSREVLGLDGERAISLPPLGDADAVKLFEARAPIGCDPSEVRGLVSLLDGLPLAIELAAARTSTLGLPEIRARMGDRFGLLARAGHPHDRHATLRATLDWSWSLLSEVERAVMGQLSVFEGSFTLDAAAAVAEGADLDVVQSLVDKSLVHRRGDRLDLLLTVRAYAAEGVDPAARAEAVVRHGEHFARLGDPAEVVALDRSVQRFELVRAELDNLVVACRRAVVGRAPTAVARGALAAVWAVVRRVGPVRLAEGLVDDVLALELDDRTLAEVSMIGAMVLQRTERAVEGVPLAARALDLARRIGPAELEAEALTTLGHCLDEVGRFEESLSVLREAVERAQQVGAPALLARALTVYGYATWRVGDRDLGVSMLEQALGIERRAGGGAQVRWILALLASIHLDEGSPLAPQLLDESLAEAERTHHPFGVVSALGFRAMCAFGAGELEEGLRRAERTLAEAQALGWRVQEGWTLLNLGRIELELDRPTARSRLEQAVVILREVERPIPLAMALGFLAWCEPTPAERWGRAQQGLELARHLGDGRTLANLWLFAGTVALDLPTARACFTEALACARAHDDPQGIAVIDSRLALIEPPTADSERRLDEALAYFERVGQRIEWGRLVAARAERAAQAGDAESTRRWLEVGRRVPA
ncbi:MAG: tetratricopeptide repeat protein, partial [Myxococcota bacterium]